MGRNKCVQVTRGGLLTHTQIQRGGAKRCGPEGRQRSVRGWSKGAFIPRPCSSSWCGSVWISVDQCVKGCGGRDIGRWLPQPLSSLLLTAGNLTPPTPGSPEEQLPGSCPLRGPLLEGGRGPGQVHRTLLYRQAPRQCNLRQAGSTRRQLHSAGFMQWLQRAVTCVATVAKGCR